jgi:hypothetical protein
MRRSPARFAGSSCRCVYIISCAGEGRSVRGCASCVSKYGVGCEVYKGYLSGRKAYDKNLCACNKNYRFLLSMGRPRRTRLAAHTCTSICQPNLAPTHAPTVMTLYDTRLALQPLDSGVVHTRLHDSGAVHTRLLLHHRHDGLLRHCHILSAVSQALLKSRLRAELYVAEYGHTVRPR